VLIIDEAYMLKSSTKGESSGVDMYKTAVIDTLVAEVQNVPGEDRYVLLLGYTDKMTELFQHANLGFARRFPLDEAFTFDNFSLDQLLLILDLKLAQQNLGATAHAKQALLMSSASRRDYPTLAWRECRKFDWESKG